MLFLSTLYAFGGPVLGIQQMGAPTMYANLRSYKGGNHYLVPTAILGEDLLFKGVVLRRRAQARLHQVLAKHQPVFGFLVTPVGLEPGVAEDFASRLGVADVFRRHDHIEVLVDAALRKLASLLARWR